MPASSTDSGTGPASLVLTASVARRFYVDGVSKSDIAEEFALSRFKVARLLEQARSSGLVRIEIDVPGGLDVELSDRLQRAYGLQHAIIVDTAEQDGPTLRTHLGRAAADLLTEIVTPQDVLGLSWARSVSAMAAALTRLPAVPVVQLTGSLARADSSDSSVEVVRRVAQVSGGPAYVFYAPLIVGDAGTARSLRNQPEVARAHAQVAQVTKAVVAVGRWAPDQSTLYDALPEQQARDLARQGLTADLSGVLVDRAGSPLAVELADRVITVTAAELRAVPEVLAIAYGPEKAPAVRAALRGGLVDGLVTHRPLAHALLDLL